MPQFVNNRIKTLLSNPGLAVLFTSDPINGDLFEFGTWEELESELEDRQRLGHDIELDMSDNLFLRLDLDIYEGSQPRIRQ